MQNAHPSREAARRQRFTAAAMFDNPKIEPADALTYAALIHEETLMNTMNESPDTASTPDDSPCVSVVPVA
ncbi:MAG: hypothetical protein NTV17_17510, partial [Burkholderiales bacterium]|nr:hypothetical protein [Burkholderiales bacterium]